MGSQNTQGKKYPSPGHCIYCGSAGGEDGLRDEHIIPLSLGGTAYIEKASCADCEAVTSYIDGYLAGVFRYHRVHAGIKRRRRKKERIPLIATISVAGEEATREFERKEDHPYFTTLPRMQPPGILLGEEPSLLFKNSQAHSYHWIPENLHKTMSADANQQVSVRSHGELNFPTFGRAIAKIAYCNAYAELLARFVPLPFVADLILGRYTYVSYLVGEADGEPPPPGVKGIIHTVTFRVESVGNLRLMVCSVRLFANSGTKEHGMPVYEVVVGVPKT